MQISANLVYGAAGAWGHLLFFIVVGLLVFLRPYVSAVPQETLVGYTLVLLYLMTPLQSFLGTMAQLGQANVEPSAASRSWACPCRLPGRRSYRRLPEPSPRT
jgi:ABC-type siderophore export system fused ATPase/permease subunit